MPAGRLSLRLFEPASARRLRVTRTLFAVLLALRAMLGPYRSLAGLPAPLFKPLGVIGWLHLNHIPGPGVIVAVQVAAMAGAALVATRRGPRAGFAVAWLAVLFLAGLRTSTGKLLHNDTLFLIASFPLLFAPPDPDDDSRSGVRYGWALSTGLAALCLVYFLTGVAKLRHSGLAWVTGNNMRYLMLAASRSGLPRFPTLAAHIGANAVLSRLVAAGILGLELSFPVAFVVRRARPIYAAGAVALHVGTWLTLGLDYWLWAAAAVLLLTDLGRLNERLARPVGPASGRPPAAASPTARPSPP